jgi:hypothetical protein
MTVVCGCPFLEHTLQNLRGFSSEFAFTEMKWLQNHDFSVVKPRKMGLMGHVTLLNGSTILKRFFIKTVKVAPDSANLSWV